MRTVTFVALALASLLLAIPPAGAVEDFPSGASVRPADAGALRDYQTRSREALARLTAIVETTEKGEEHLRNEWEVISAAQLAHLKRLDDERKVPEHLGDWHAAEVAAWTNVRRIGAELIDLHYKMASTIEEIEQDVRVSQAFSRKWQERMGRIDGDAGDLAAIFEALNKATDDFETVKDLAGTAGNTIGTIEYATRTLVRLYNTYKFRKEKFIKEKDLLADYKRKLAALRDADIDPDQSGRFLAAEQRWEERMFRTHRRYLDAVQDWNKANEWIGKGKIGALLKKGLPIFLGEFAKWKDLDPNMAMLSLADVNNLEKRAGQIRDALGRFMEKVRGETWARIERELLDANEELALLKIRRDRRLEEIGIEAGQRALDAGDKINARLEALEEEQQRLLRKLAHAKGNRGDKINREIDRVEADMAVAIKELVKLRDYYEVVWKRQEELKAIAEFERAKETVESRLKMLASDKSSL